VAQLRVISQEANGDGLALWVVNGERSLDGLSREELEALVRSLREENERLRAELRALRRDSYETPPHYQ
jgi:hypothetical protein